MSAHSEDADTLADSEVFHLLGNDRRRAIIRILTESPDPADVSAVATRIAEGEADRTPVPNNVYKSVYVSLQQTHLPQLEEEGIVVYDPNEKTVERGPRFDEVRSYVGGEPDTFSTIIGVHLAVCVLALAVIAAAALGLPVVGAIDSVIAAVVALLVVCASSLYRLLA